MRVKLIDSQVHNSINCVQPSLFLLRVAWGQVAIIVKVILSGAPLTGLGETLFLLEPEMLRI